MLTKLLQEEKLIDANQVVRLPYEDEWEYCAAAGTKTDYSFGDDVGKLNEYAWSTHNAAGNDRYDGQSAQQSGERLGPVRTIRRALRLATASDRIVLANTGVPYRESITLFGRNNSGLENFPFILDGKGATLEGADPVPQDAWRPYSHYIFRFRPEK